jgi:ABC-type transport system involved in multi-copper enzyme maturation permease subunit
MLLKLLKRDLRLHWDALVIPLLILIVIMGAIGLANEGVALVGLLLIGFLFIPFLPMAIHMRETTQGSLGDLMSLPVSRAALVSLRYLEVLLFAAVALTLAHLGTWVALSAAAHKAVHFQVMDRSGVIAFSLLLLICFAYPMPFTFRWGGKGISVAFGILIGGFMAYGLVSQFYPKLMALLGNSLFRCLIYLLGTPGQPNDAGHPGQIALLFLGLFAASYGLSLKAFAGKDF